MDDGTDNLSVTSSQSEPKIKNSSATVNNDVSSALTRQKIRSVQKGSSLLFADSEDDESWRRKRWNYAWESIEAEKFVSSDFIRCKDNRVPPLIRNPSYQAAIERESSPDSSRSLNLHGCSANSLSDLCNNLVAEPSDCQLFQNFRDSNNSIYLESLEVGGTTKGRKSSVKKTSDEACVNSRLKELVDLSIQDTKESLSDQLSSEKVEFDKDSQNEESCSLASKLSLEERKLSQRESYFGRSASFSDRYSRRQFSEENSSKLGDSQSSSTESHILADKEPVLSRGIKKLMSSQGRIQKSLSYSVSHGGVSHTAHPEEAEEQTKQKKIGSSLARKLSLGSKLSIRRRQQAPKDEEEPQPASTSTQVVLNGNLKFENEEIVCYESLLKLFMCPGCGIFMTPPLHQCRKGHLVCSTCKANVKQMCPVCKQRFSEYTNLMMEQVSQLLRFPCKFAKMGCPECLTLKNKMNHEHFCTFRPIYCQNQGSGCPVYLTLKDMEKHMETCQYQQPAT